MTIDPAAERFLAVVQMKGTQSFDAHDPIELSHGGSIFALGCERIARGKEMAGVQADPDSSRLADALQNLGEMLKAMPEVTLIASVGIHRVLLRQFLTRRLRQPEACNQTNPINKKRHRRGPVREMSRRAGARHH